jgi:hypothetical protein
VFVSSRARLAVLGMPMMFTGEINQGIQIIYGLEINIAPPASITAIWSAFGDELFAPKAQAAVTTIAGYYLNLCFINKHNVSIAYIISRIVSGIYKKRMV